jgi:hypothetical protein
MIRHFQAEYPVTIVILPSYVSRPTVEGSRVIIQRAASDFYCHIRAYGTDGAKMVDDVMAYYQDGVQFVGFDSKEPPY